MHYSNDRILVTQVGSLPRSPALLDMLGQTEAAKRSTAARSRRRCSTD